MRSPFTDLIRKKYRVLCTCPECGQERQGITSKINRYHFTCFRCGKRTHLRNAKGDNCKFKILHEIR